MVTVETNRPTIDFIYNPDNQTKRQLINSFVVRLKTFRRLFDDIKGATMNAPEQHYLIEGKRGMGKTTLLLRLAYEIENDGKLNTWLIPIVFNEEEYSIRKLYKLWERIAKLLEDKDAQFIGLYEEMDNSYANFQKEEDYEYSILQLLNKRLEAKGKKLILFIDNFGDIFSKFNKQEVQRLRTVLQTNANFRIFGASSVVLEAFYDNKHPFFEFFKVSRLRGLDKEETIDLLLKLGETYKQEQIKDIIANQLGRVESLRRLTGGVIRTIVLLFEIFIDKKQGSAFSDLEAILDRVTPLYKHRMDDLPAQQQEIVTAIAFAWDAINVSEISQKTRIISKTVSAQLRQMEKNEIITKKLTHNKNHLYQISERFFNIWFLMRHGRKGDKRKVLWLVRFLEEWCDEKELVNRTNRHIGYLKNGSYNEKGAYYLTEALASTSALPSQSQDELIKVTRAFLKKKNSDFINHLSESDLELHEKAMEFYEKDDFQEALLFLLKMKNKDYYRISSCYYFLKNFSKAEEYCLFDIKQGNTKSLFNLGVLYQDEFKDFKKAEKFYLKAVKEGNDKAMFNLGLLYKNEFKDFKKAEKFYLKAVEKEHVGAMFNLANLYWNEFKEFKKAEKLYFKAVEKENVDAMFNLAFLYGNEFKDFKKAEKFYLKAVVKENVNAMNNLANLYWNEFKDFKKAEKFYLKAVEKEHVNAMFNLALLYENEFQDFKKAEKFYLKAVVKENVGAMNNLALLYETEFKDFKKAEKFYLKAAEKDDADAINNLAILYFDKKINPQKALKLIEKAYIKIDDIVFKINYPKILLWNHQIEKALILSESILKEKEALVQHKNSLSDLLYLLLSKHQYQFLYDYFTSPKAQELNIKDQLKPIWYALMYYMQDQYPNEYLRMGEELEETVKEIIEKVEQMRIDYA